MSRKRKVVPGNLSAVPFVLAGAKSRLFQYWQNLFLLSESQALFVTRGFVASDPSQRTHLEGIGKIFISGYNLGLIDAELVLFDELLDSLRPSDRGFFMEGAAMGASISDGITPGQSRLASLFSNHHGSYTYLLHVGVGWALARMPWRDGAVRDLLDPVHHWLIYDGIGFHDAYFHSVRLEGGWRRIKTSYQAEAYLQGVGRGLWFVSGGNVERAARAIGRVRDSEQAGLWSGLGLAVAYAGFCGPKDLAKLALLAGNYRAHLVQGAAFAAEAHYLAGPIPPHTQDAVRTLCEMEPRSVVSVVRKARDGLPKSPGSALPIYEIWRQEVRQILLARSERSPCPIG